jgi:RNA polymerase sigma factor (sigma-70 family)
MTTDAELLRNYAETGAEEAFAELVRRRLNLVYSAAMRQVNGDAHLAQDVAQMVFADLARKASALSRRQSLTGWLYTSTHFAASKVVRTENRRRQHEQEAQAMNELLQTQEHEPDWKTLAPVLDDVMHELDEPVREVLLLRYFENRKLGDVGKLLGVSEDGARKRVERALEKLRACLLRRGITTSAALAMAISSNAVQPAPAGLAATLATNSAVGATAAAGAKLTFWNIMAMSKTKLGIAVLVAGCMTIPLAMQHRTQASLREEISRLRQQLDSAVPAVAANQILPTADTNAPTMSADEFKELLKLRGEVGLLREQAREQKTANSRGPTDQSAAPQMSTGGSKLASRSFVPRSELAFAGYASPEAALESVLWAENQTNVVSYLASLVPDAQQSEQDRLQKEFINGVAQPFFRTGNLVTGFQLLETNRISDDEIALTFFMGGRGGTIKLPAKRIGDEWKMYVGPTF